MFSCKNIQSIQSKGSQRNRLQPRASTTTTNLSRKGQHANDLYTNGSILSRRVVLAGTGLSLIALPDITAKALPAMANDALPRAYTSLVEQIASSLRESIETEANGANESEVRRKADPANKNVKEFVAKWRDDPRVSWHPSHQEVLGTVTELGVFYKKAGPRSRLSEEARVSIRSHLGRMEASLKDLSPPIDNSGTDDELRGLIK